MHRVIEGAASRPFAWGTHDCCAAACSVVEAETGENPMRGLRRYATRLGAARVVAPYGGVDGIVAAVAAQHGFEEIDPKWAQRGDIALVPGDGTFPHAMAIIAGAEALTAGEIGWRRWPIASVLRAWRV